MFRYAAPAALLLFASPALAQHQHDHTPPAQNDPAPPQHQHDHAPATQHDPAQHQHEPAPEDWGDVMGERMTGVLGPYRPGRDASGTAWQPDVSPSHGGMHASAGEWMLMAHVMLNGVYDWQDGPRGDEKGFISGMIMGSARRDVGERGTLNLRAMLAPDPFMGANGYPLLLAAGETANGVDPLVDRQHPHDLFMELSASYAHQLSPSSSVFVYGGLPGEPAFGPPAFMHRLAAMDSPEAPITHHWFDSTHITFGVLTAGYVQGDWKIEASRFRGREPDEDRYDIEGGELDSTSLRLSWNPSANWSLQASWADIISPEALHPNDDEERWSVSAIYTRNFGDGGWWSATGAFANKERSDGVSLDAWLLEAALHPNDRWTLFARGEAIETDELGAHHGPVEDVARISLGAIRDWQINENTVFGVGALVQTHLVPNSLAASYGGDPEGAMAFVRLKIG